MRVSFFGVRGSTPCCSTSVSRIGGNTSCVVVVPENSEPIILDLGTGLRSFGCTWPAGKPFHGTALVSHLHWDHVQGLPFFAPSVTPGSTIDLYGPTQEDGRTLRDAVDEFMRPPYFPITLQQLPADIRIMECPSEPFAVGTATVTACEVPHVGRTFGYRIEADGVAIAYIPDHQQPFDGSNAVDEAVLDLCRNADLVIHDAQYTDAEFAVKYNWGHCTISYAVSVAAQAGARRLALFHHDPSHTDDQMDALAAAATIEGRKLGVDVFAAGEGVSLCLGTSRYAPLS